MLTKFFTSMALTAALTAATNVQTAASQTAIASLASLDDAFMQESVPATLAQTSAEASMLQDRAGDIDLSTAENLVFDLTYQWNDRVNTKGLTIYTVYELIKSKEKREDIIAGALKISKLEFALTILTADTNTDAVLLNFKKPRQKSVNVEFINMYHPACSVFLHFDFGLEGPLAKTLTN